MLRQLLDFAPPEVVYIQLWRERIKVTNLMTDKAYDQASFVHITTLPSGKKKLLLSATQQEYHNHLIPLVLTLLDTLAAFSQISTSWRKCLNRYSLKSVLHVFLLNAW